jgi:hypothetical protein
MHLQKAKRQQVKLKLSLAGASGSGKTYSALLLAYGLCNDWSKIAVIDTENYSASFYCHLGKFNVVNITPPFTPEKYIEAIKLCETERIEVIIIDSISHEWSGKGGCLEIHETEMSKMRVPNSFTAWASVTPRHQSFIDAVIMSGCHIISNIRSKTEYILSERNGKITPQKVGMAPITRDGFEFEVSVAFDIDQSHKASSSKDRTGLFNDQQPFMITPSTGQTLLRWSQWEDDFADPEMINQISNCKNIQELLKLYEQKLPVTPTVKKEFEQQKKKLLLHTTANNQILNLNQTSKNGTA